MPEFAKSYQFGDSSKVPTIDGQEFPWYISIVGPMVESEEATNGATHILWVPVMVDAPMPTPPQGRPGGDKVDVVDGLGITLRTVPAGEES